MIGSHSPGLIRSGQTSKPAMKPSSSSSNIASSPRLSSSSSSCLKRRDRLGMGAPIPWQQIVELVNRVFGDASEDVSEPGLRINIVHLGRDDQAVHDRGSLAATIGAAE